MITVKTEIHTWVSYARVLMKIVVDKFNHKPWDLIIFFYNLIDLTGNYLLAHKPVYSPVYF